MAQREPLEAQVQHIVQPVAAPIADGGGPGKLQRVLQNLLAERVPIRRANYLVRAVAVGEGAHVVEFSYEPWSFRLGAAISLLTLALGCESGVALWRRSSRIPVEAP